MVDEEMTASVWIVYPERLRGNEALRVLIDCLVDQIEVRRQAA
jgi:hypothetical protein